MESSLLVRQKVSSLLAFYGEVGIARRSTVGIGYQLHMGVQIDAILFRVSRMHWVVVE